MTTAGDTVRVAATLTREEHKHLVGVLGSGLQGALGGTELLEREGKPDLAARSRRTADLTRALLAKLAPAPAGASSFVASEEEAGAGAPTSSPGETA